MGQKTYYVVSCSYSSGVHRWAHSLVKNRGEVQPIVIMYQDHFEVPGDFIVHKQNKKFPGVVQRLFPVREIVEQYGEEHWYVWTDCCDVVLQTPLPDLSDFGADILVCSEQLLHKEAEFWSFIKNSKYFKNLLTLTIYNVGCFAMKGSQFKEYCIRLEEFCKLVNTFDGCLDQLFFNKWIRAQSYKSVDRLFICLYSTFTDGHRLWSGERMKLAERVNDQFIANEIPYCIVHGNGYTKEILGGIKY